VNIYKAMGGGWTIEAEKLTAEEDNYGGGNKEKVQRKMQTNGISLVIPPDLSFPQAKRVGNPSGFFRKIPDKPE
jgi:hypothetical protein